MAGSGRLHNVPQSPWDGSSDRRRFSSMGMTRFWHPQLMWCGPGGIGTRHSNSWFERHHQKPFLVALPDRKGGKLRARLASCALRRRPLCGFDRLAQRAGYATCPIS